MDARMNRLDPPTSDAAGLIDAYLTELRHSTAHLGDVDDIVDEAADHLFLTADRFEADGRSRSEAEALALARFGSAPLVARTHIVQEQMGAAVPTRSTRMAGMAIMLTAPLAILGAASNNLGEAHAEGWRGAVHGPGAVLEGLTLLVFLFGLWGLRHRHGGLGGWGRAALILTIASPFLAAPFTYAAGFALAFLLTVAFGLLLVGMWQVQVLSRAPILLMSVGVSAFIAGSFVAWPLGELWPLLAGSVLTAVGYTWSGWTLWCEPALDAAAEPPLPTATA